VATEVKILDVRPMPAADPARVGKRDTVVVYSVANGAARRVTLPKENATKAEIEAAIRANETASAALIGSTFTL
jgi:hypothetical protein